MRTRAIYIPDARYDTCNVFELQGDKFVCINDNGIQYDVEDVLCDKDWLIISVDGTLVENVR
jgi:hypothetical protein